MDNRKLKEDNERLTSQVSELTASIEGRETAVRNSYMKAEKVEA